VGLTHSLAKWRELAKKNAVNANIYRIRNSKKRINGRRFLALKVPDMGQKRHNLCGVLNDKALIPGQSPIMPERSLSCH